MRATSFPTTPLVAGVNGRIGGGPSGDVAGGDGDVIDDGDDEKDPGY